MADRPHYAYVRYQEHVERLATITEVGGYPLAVENRPDASCYHTPEDIAALAFLTEQVPRLDDISILIDTAHVAMERRALTVDEPPRPVLPTATPPFSVNSTTRLLTG